jgi:hypothetical protein
LPIFGQIEVARFAIFSLPDCGVAWLAERHVHSNLCIRKTERAQSSAPQI